MAKSSHFVPERRRRRKQQQQLNDTTRQELIVHVDLTVKIMSERCLLQVVTQNKRVIISSSLSLEKPSMAKALSKEKEDEEEGG